MQAVYCESSRKPTFWLVTPCAPCTLELLVYIYPDLCNLSGEHSPRYALIVRVYVYLQCTATKKTVLTKYFVWCTMQMLMPMIMWSTLSKVYKWCGMFVSWVRTKMAIVQKKHMLLWNKGKRRKGVLLKQTTEDNKKLIINKKILSI